MSVELTQRFSYRGSRHYVYSVYRNGELIRTFDEMSDDHAWTNASELKREMEKEIKLNQSGD